MMIYRMNLSWPKTQTIQVAQIDKKIFMLQLPNVAKAPISCVYAKKELLPLANNGWAIGNPLCI